MESILEAINEWIKEILIGAINGNLSTMFGDVNEKVGTIAAEVGKTPQGWNANIFSMIQNLSENVIVPIAGLVITYVLCYELISMVTEKNNMHDIETFMFFKWFFKAFVAVFLVTHPFGGEPYPYSERVDDEQHRYFYPVHHTGTISDWGCPVLWLKCPVKQHDTLRPQAA